MHRALLLLLTAAVVSASSHFGYIRLASACDAPVACSLPAGSDSPLEWLALQLDLTPDQAAAARRLHEQWSPTLDTLRTRLAHERLAARATGDTAGCLLAEGECRANTTRLIAEMAALLTPAQRHKYYALVAVCVPPAAAAAAAQNLTPNPGSSR